MISLTTHGQTGVLSSSRGLGPNISALSGLSYLVGWPGRGPAGLTNPLPDWVQPAFAMLPLLAALEHKRKTGKGQYIDITQFETVSFLLAPHFLDYFANGEIWELQGNRHPYASPHGVYQCQGEEVRLPRPPAPQATATTRYPAAARRPQLQGSQVLPSRLNNTMETALGRPHPRSETQVACARRVRDPRWLTQDTPSSCTSGAERSRRQCHLISTTHSAPSAPRLPDQIESASVCRTY